MNKSPVQPGFTLIELMVTVALMAVILTLGVPSFRELIQNNRMTAQANDFLAALSFARSESLKRGIRVTLCKSANASGCAPSGNWDQGWIIFADGNNNATADDGAGSILKVHSSLGASTLTGNANIASYVSYVSTGFTQLISGALQAGTFTLCPGTSNSKGRSIVISSTGRAKVSDVTCP